MKLNVNRMASNFDNNVKISCLIAKKTRTVLGATWKFTYCAQDGAVVSRRWTNLPHCVRERYMFSTLSQCTWCFRV